MTHTEAIDHNASYLPISDYAAIGDSLTGALVSRDGSIDWCCLPNFDSGAVFCKILDKNKGGFCEARPLHIPFKKRRYLENTNVLETTFSDGDNCVTITDFFVCTTGEDNQDERLKHSRILRVVKATAGSACISIVVRPTFDFARRKTQCIKEYNGHFLLSDQAHGIFLTSNIAFDSSSHDQLTAHASITKDQTLFLSMEYVQDRSLLQTDQRHVTVESIERDLQDTLAYWQGWISQCQYRGHNETLVKRSALVLKLLTFRPSGAVIAALSTSLPESLGYSRNWDYRFTWLRDASLILHCLQTLGFHSESVSFFDWIKRIYISRSQDLHIMYNIWGNQTGLREEILEHLEGYYESRPVRIGNGAADQVQIDSYGHILNAIWHCFKTMPRSIHEDLKEAVIFMAQRTKERWKEKGYGIWEARSQCEEYIHSKVLCWVGLDRAIRLAELIGEKKWIQDWKETCDEIKKYVLDAGFDPQKRAFIQATGKRVIDASALAYPLLGFIEANDPKMLATIERIREELSVNGFIYRYSGDDGIEGKEGAFLICTFWFIENLVLLGRLDEATELFHRATAVANDLGLLSEEVDPKTGDLLGNFPQGFSHLSLISCAIRLESAAREKHAGTPQEGIK